MKNKTKFEYYLQQDSEMAVEEMDEIALQVQLVGTQPVMTNADANNRKLQYRMQVMSTFDAFNLDWDRESEEELRVLN